MTLLGGGADPDEAQGEVPGLLPDRSLRGVGRRQPLPLPAGLVEAARRLGPLGGLDHFAERQAGSEVLLVQGALLRLAALALQPFGLIAPQTRPRRFARGGETLVQVVVDVRQQVGPGLLGRGERFLKRLALRRSGEALDRFAPAGLPWPIRVRVGRGPRRAGGVVA